MPDAHASALAGLAPGRLLRFANALLGGPFATHARASDALSLRTPSLQSNPSWPSNGSWRARVSGNGNIAATRTMVRNAAGAASLEGRFAPSRNQTRPHRADTCCSFVAQGSQRLDSRQVSALFGPRTTPDSPALHPLHSSRSSPAFRRNSIGSMPGLRSFVPTAANCRDRQNSSCAPEDERLQRARGFAYCPGHSIMARCSACRPRPARTSNRPRGFATAKTSALAVSTASFRSAWLRETVRPHW